jgi:transposase
MLKKPNFRFSIKNMRRAKMSRRGVSMRKIKEVMRLKNKGGLSQRSIASSCKLSPTTVGNILAKAKKKKINLPENGGSEEALLGLKTPTIPENKQEEKKRPMPDMEHIAKELKKKGVTRQLLWEEYKDENPNGYAYTQFCEYFNRWKKTHVEPTMRFEHKAGEKMFVDWAGPPVIYFEKGQEKKAYLFVATLGASNYTFAAVYQDMKLPNWIKAHLDAYNFFGGVPEQTVPDNAKTGVSAACRYDPDLNPTYHEMAGHFGTVVLPARPNKPRDKSKVEQAVQFAERRIIAALRKIKFLSFGELARAVKEKNIELNRRPFSKMPGCREKLFNEIEKDALSALPEKDFCFGEWKKASVFIDYHIQCENHYYSVPCRHIGKTVDVRLAAGTVEIFLDGVRIALHQRSYQKGKATTLKEHMPPKHSMMLNESADKLIAKAEKIGPSCADAITEILSRMPRPEMGFRGCQGVIRLGKQYGHDRLEKACSAALKLDCCRYREIDRMLKNNLEDLGALKGSIRTNNYHRNIRGSDYYNTQKNYAKGTAKC